MSVMNYVSSEIKIIAVKHSLVGTESLNQSAARFGVSRSTLQKWMLNYEMFGTEGLCHRAGNHLDLVRENQQSSAHNFVKDFSSFFPESRRRSPLKKGAGSKKSLNMEKQRFKAPAIRDFIYGVT